MKLLLCACAATALLLSIIAVHAEEPEDIVVEQTTESPIADMALVGNHTMKTGAVETDSGTKTEEENKKQLAVDSQQHTVADFIIHPLIAWKPRVPAAENGKQADTSSTTNSPWQFFPFNAAQGIGSSVSSLAGWLGNRIQLPGLVDTPVRESTSTTTTTARPDVIVRVMQRATTKKPLITINNNNNRPYRRKTRPNRFNANYAVDNYDSDEYDDDDDDDDFNGKQGYRRRHQEYEDDENEEDVSYEEDEEDGAEINENEYEDDNNEEQAEGDTDRPAKQQNNNHRKHSKPTNYNKRRYSPNQGIKQLQQEDSAEADQNEDYDDNENFYYNRNQEAKRSKNELNFIQRGQQSLLNQIKHFTRGLTPAEVGNSLRKSQKSTNKKHRQQATIIINRNGQAVYIAPEFLQASDAATSKKRPSSQYPQPPLTIPYRRKGQPVQYITIPWSQLGISPPDNIASLAEGVQSQPFILSIPQSAIANMQSLEPNKIKKKPSITADAVPLLAEASIMDIFKPPRIPPARSPASSKPNKNSAAGSTPVIIATKTKPGPTLIRGDTIVEKSPAGDAVDGKKNSSATMEDDSQSAQFIVIGDDFDERKLTRNTYRQILNYFNQNRLGRQVDGAAVAQSKEQLLPVQVIYAAEEPLKQKTVINDKLEMTTKSSIAIESPKEETVQSFIETSPSP